MEKRKSMIFYESHYQTILKLKTDKEQLAFLKMIFNYCFYREEPKEFNFTFDMIRNQLDNNLDKYELICERNRKNGAKGGRPKKETQKPKNPMGYSQEADKTKACEISPKPKNLDNDNDYDNDYEYDYDNDNDNEYEREGNRSPAPARFPFGKYKNIFLSESDFKELNQKYGEDITRKYIKKMSEYLEESGKTYNNYFLKLSKWIEEDQEKQTGEAQEQTQEYITPKFEIEESQKLVYGSFKNVFMYLSEYQSLQKDYGFICYEYIEKLSRYFHNNPEKSRELNYQDHYQNILKWIKADTDKKKYE